jgi:hypothetical protein
MHSDLIGKIEKAKRYAQEPDRVSVLELKATFHGGNHDHELALRDGHWHCSCDTAHRWGTCAHVMALQTMLEPMLSASARQVAGPELVEESV